MTQEEAQILRINAWKYVDVCPIGPNTGLGWSKILIEANHPILEEWRSDFYDELCSTNETYRKSLEDSVRWFGVRWGK